MSAHKTRSSGRVTGGVSYKDLNEYGFPEAVTDRSSGAISKSPLSASKNKLQDAASQLDHSISAAMTEHQEELEDEDPEITALKHTLDMKSDELKKRRKEMEKERLRAEIDQKEKELKQFKQKGEKPKKGKSKKISEKGIDDLRQMKDLNNKVYGLSDYRLKLHLPFDGLHYVLYNVRTR